MFAQTLTKLEGVLLDSKGPVQVGHCNSSVGHCISSVMMGWDGYIEVVHSSVPGSAYLKQEH